MQEICAGKVEVRQPEARERNVRPHAGDALIIVDVQNDFLPGGSLAVAKGDTVIGPLNRYLAAFVQRNLPVFVSGDYHPPNHCSFEAQGGPWPPHCVVSTTGAAFPESLALPSSATVLRKGNRADTDVYSAFEGTDLEARLRQANVRRVFAGGLATDYCVLHTVLDARRLGFETFVLEDAIRAVDAQPGDGDRAVSRMVEKGAQFIRLEDLVHAD